MMAGLEDRAGAGHRQHRRAEAVRADPDDRGAPGADLAAEHLPPGVLNVIYGHGEPAGAGSCAIPDVAMVSLTGDVATGKEIARTAADTLKRVHLELGGKAPVVVFDDADVEAAIEGVKIGGYFNAGQDCTAASRVLAGPGIHDDFVSGLADAVVVAQDGRSAVGRHRARAARLEVAARAGAGLPRPRRRRTPRSSPAARRRVRSRLLLRADRRRGPRAGRRDGPARGVRPGRHGPAASIPTSRRSSGPTASTTAWRRRCGRATSAGR